MRKSFQLELGERRQLAPLKSFNLAQPFGRGLILHRYNAPRRAFVSFGLLLIPVYRLIALTG
jgi:hypothetical protein